MTWSGFPRFRVSTSSSAPATDRPSGRNRAARRCSSRMASSVAASGRESRSRPCSTRRDSRRGRSGWSRKGGGPGAKWLLAEGGDAAAMTRSIPIEKALDDALLVYAQNGERLRPEQGYPLRLLLPGFEGNMNVKWLRRIKVGDAPFYSREETSKYTDLLAEGRAREFSFVMEAKSVITRPSGGKKLRTGFNEIRGLAWSGRGRIARVDVSVDGGKSWQRASLDEPVLPKCLTRFRLPWSWQGGPALLQSRSVDDTGYVQPSRMQLVAVRGLNSYYHNNSIQSWHVAAGGEVTNVHA